MPMHIKSDLARLKAMSDEEIEQAALDDPDAPPSSESLLAQGKLMHLENFMRSRQSEVCLRLDSDIADWLRDNGSTCHDQINDALRAFINSQNRA